MNISIGMKKFVSSQQTFSRLGILKQVRSAVGLTKTLIFTLFAFVGIVLPQVVNAQGGNYVVTIGTGTSSHYYAPFNPYYRNSTAEMIYTAAEVGTIGTIDTIWFYSSSSTTFACSSLKVYMGTTTNNNFSSSSPWILSNELEEVFDAGGSINIGGSMGWYAIPLQTPFFYTGDNLVVAVTKTASDYSSSSKWAYTTTSSNYQTYYRQSDSDVSYGSITSLTSSTSGSSSSDRPNIKISIDTAVSGCVRPRNMSVTDVTYNSATLSWTGCDDAVSYELCYGTTNNLATYESSSVSVYDAIHYFDNLLDSTTYYVWVRSFCGSEYTAWTSFSFTTQVACARVADVTIDSLSESVAIVSWNVDPVGQPLQHVLVQYKADDASTWITDSVSGVNTYTISPLQGGTSYTVRLISICLEDTSSTVLLQFETPTCGEYDGSTTTSCYVPFHGNYNYGYSQAIYPASGLAGVTTITGISFNIESTPYSYLNRTITIAMGNTSMTTLSTSNYVPYSSMTVVASNVSMDVSNTGWVYIPFTTPFFYDGTSNVVVAVSNLTGHYSSFYFYHHTPTIGNSVYWYQDSSPINPSSPSASNSGTSPTVPDVHFEADCGGSGSNCDRPSNLSADIVSYNSVDLSWTGTSANSYEVRYSTTMLLTDSNAVTVSANSDIFTLTGLRNNTTYYIWVRSVCDEGSSGWSAPVSVTTLLACATLLNAQVVDTGQTYISLTWEVDTTQGFPLTQVLVEWRAMGEGTWQNTTVSGINAHVITGLRSGVVYEVRLTSICGTDSSSALTLSVSTPACREYANGTTTNSYVPFNGNYNYGYSQIIYPNTVLGGVDTIRGISFRTTSAPSSYLTRPVSVAMGNTSRTSLSTSNYIQYSSLTEVVSHYPMDVSTPGWIYIPFTTPFIYDGYSNIVVAVTNHTGSYSSFSFAHHSTTVGNAVYWYQDSNPINPSSPSASSNGTTTTVPDIRFDASCNFSGCVPPLMVVNYVGSSDIQIMWIPIGTETEWVVGYSMGEGGNWSYSSTTATSYVFSGLIPNTTYSLRVGVLCDGDTLFYENSATTRDGFISICFPPYGLTATATSTTEIDISWIPLGSESQWEVHVYNNETDSMFIATASSWHVEGLDTATEYHVEVRAVCDEGDYSEWCTPVIVTTREVVYECLAPVQLTVIAAIDSSVVLSWTSRGRETKWQVNVYNATFDSIYRVYSCNVALSGLSSQTSYNVKIRSICGEGDTSDWGVADHFTTTRRSGIEGVDGNASVRIYPNPATRSTSIDVSGVSGKVTISVLDVGGRVVRSEQMECEATCVKTLQVEELAQGAYFVRVAADNYCTVQKLFVE